MKPIPILAIISLLLAFLCGAVQAAQPFVHPGNWHTQADIDRIRTNVAADKEPWKSAWVAFKDSQAGVDYQPHVQAKVTDSYALQNDGHAAYCLAVKWMVSGDKKYAAAAIRIINAWTSEVKAIPNDTLRVGLGATKMVNAAEILRYADRGAAGWSPEDAGRCEKFFKELVFPVIKQNGGGGWGTPCLSALVGIGVFCNDRDIYNLGCKMYLEDRGETDPGCGKSCLKEYVFANGQNGDSYRDQGHSQGALAHLGEVCETAWNQGDDLYGAYDNLLLKGYEYVAKYNLGYDVEFIPYTDCHGNFKGSISSAGRGKFSPMYEMIYNHYVNRKGIPAPYTKMVRDKYAPEVTNGDNAGIGTLTFTREPFTSPKTTR